MAFFVLRNLDSLEYLIVEATDAGSIPQLTTPGNPFSLESPKAFKSFSAALDFTQHGFAAKPAEIDLPGGPSNLTDRPAQEIEHRRKLQDIKNLAGAKEKTDPVANIDSGTGRVADASAEADAPKDPKAPPPKPIETSAHGKHPVGESIPAGEISKEAKEVRETLQRSSQLGGDYEAQYLADKNAKLIGGEAPEGLKSVKSHGEELSSKPTETLKTTKKQPSKLPSDFIIPKEATPSLRDTVVTHKILGEGKIVAFPRDRSRVAILFEKHGLQEFPAKTLLAPNRFEQDDKLQQLARGELKGRTEPVTRTPEKPQPVNRTDLVKTPSSRTAFTQVDRSSLQATSSDLVRTRAVVAATATAAATQASRTAPSESRTTPIPAGKTSVPESRTAPTGNRTTLTIGSFGESAPRLTPGRTTAETFDPRRLMPGVDDLTRQLISKARKQGVRVVTSAQGGFDMLMAEAALRAREAGADVKLSVVAADPGEGENLPKKSPTARWRDRIIKGADEVHYMGERVMPTRQDGSRKSEKEVWSEKNRNRSRVQQFVVQGADEVVVSWNRQTKTAAPDFDVQTTRGIRYAQSLGVPITNVRESLTEHFHANRTDVILVGPDGPVNTPVPQGPRFVGSQKSVGLSRQEIFAQLLTQSMASVPVNMPEEQRQKEAHRLTTKQMKRMGMTPPKPFKPSPANIANRMAPKPFDTRWEPEEHRAGNTRFKEISPVGTVERVTFDTHQEARVFANLTRSRHQEIGGQQVVHVRTHRAPGANVGFIPYAEAGGQTFYTKEAYEAYQDRLGEEFSKITPEGDRQQGRFGYTPGDRKVTDDGFIGLDGGEFRSGPAQTERIAAEDRVRRVAHWDKLVQRNRYFDTLEEAEAFVKRKKGLGHWIEWERPSIATRRKPTGGLEKLIMVFQEDEEGLVRAREVWAPANSKAARKFTDWYQNFHGITKRPVGFRVRYKELVPQFSYGLKEQIQIGAEAYLDMYGGPPTGLADRVMRGRETQLDHLTDPNRADRTVYMSRSFHLKGAEKPRTGPVKVPEAPKATERTRPRGRADTIVMPAREGTRLTIQDAKAQTQAELARIRSLPFDPASPSVVQPIRVTKTRPSAPQVPKAPPQQGLFKATTALAIYEPPVQAVAVVSQPKVAAPTPKPSVVLNLNPVASSKLLPRAELRSRTILGALPRAATGGVARMALGLLAAQGINRLISNERSKPAQTTRSGVESMLIATTTANPELNAKLIQTTTRNRSTVDVERAMLTVATGAITGAVTSRAVQALATHRIGAASGRLAGFAAGAIAWTAIGVLTPTMVRLKESAQRQASGDFGTTEAYVMARNSAQALADSAAEEFEIEFADEDGEILELSIESDDFSDIEDVQTDEGDPIPFSAYTQTNPFTPRL